MGDSIYQVLERPLEFLLNMKGGKKLTMVYLLTMCMYVCVSRFSHFQLFEIPWTIAHQAPLSMGFPKQLIHNIFIMCVYKFKLSIIIFVFS